MTVDESKLIGKKIDRIDGRLKVTGQAKYAGDTPMSNLCVAVAILSSIAKGKIKRIDRKEAEKAPGVVAVYTYENPPMNLSATEEGKNLFLFNDADIRFDGQIIGLVVAETFEQARYAASLVQVSYAAGVANTELAAADNPVATKDGVSKRGDPSTGRANAAKVLTNTYKTPMETHNPMEPFATVAVWEGDALTLHDSTQAVFAVRKKVATILGVKPEKVRVIANFTGGGFGCKLSVWAPVVLAAMAAKKLGRPVKLVLARREMFGGVGFRPATVQTITLGALSDGTLTTIEHHTVQETSAFADFTEETSAGVKTSYACANLETSHKLARLDIGKPTWMRAPGHAPGSFALECAMDELAYELKMDPIDLRIKNYAKVDPDSGLPWSSNSLLKCYEEGKKRFQWDRRNAAAASMKDGNQLVGMGMAVALHSVWRNPASASAEIFSDGTALVLSGTQDIGTGTYTIMTQIACEKLTLPLPKVTFKLGDTNMPEAPMSGGSTTAGSVGQAVAKACDDAVEKLKQLAIADPTSLFFKNNANAIVAKEGHLRSTTDDKKAESFTQVLNRTKKRSIKVTSKTEVSDAESKYSMCAFGAQFAEVRIDLDLGTIKVARFVGAYAAGTILNHKTARSQLLGGINFGISMALAEDTIMDHKFGRILNADLAEYHIPVHADIGSLDPFFIEEVDEQCNSLGAKGIGELGITGAAAAIANAVYHATGKRVRDLPITLDKLL